MNRDFENAARSYGDRYLDTAYFECGCYCSTMYLALRGLFSGLRATGIGAFFLMRK